MNYRDEPLEIKEIFENDEFVAFKVKYDWFGDVMIQTNVGIKNEVGDIIRSETVKSEVEPCARPLLYIFYKR
ncbi:MAG: hypothetical protein LUG95_08280 [Clostridiales bacterium]|nr:hypothetical protein [Clostridiales bacterium]